MSSTLSLGTVLCLPFISPSHAVDYSFEPCCNLCTQAADPESYNTAFRRKFRQLQAGKDGWLFRSHQDFMETFGPDESGYQDLQEMHQLLLAKGTRLVMAIQPTRALAHPEFVDPSTSQFDWGLAKMGFNTMMQRFQSLGIPIADFSEFIPFQAEGFYFFRRDHHWTPTGAKVSAEKVAEVIKQFPEYEQIPPVEISSSQSGLINKVGTLQVAAHQICGFNYPNEYVPQYSSSATLNSDLLDDSSLFDDELPQITLIGTSNSRGTVDYNFQGFLMEALQRDVLNVAMAGAGYYGALVQYLLSDDYIDAPPKIIVWEVPPYHKLQSPLFYRQAKPMITNGCQSREVVMSDTQSLSVGRNELLFNGGGKVADLKSGDLVVDFQFDNPNLKEVNFTIWYMTGRKEELKLKIPSRVTTGGRFMVELNRTPEFTNLPYLGMDVHVDTNGDPDQKPTSVQATLCRESKHAAVFASQ